MDKDILYFDLFKVNRGKEKLCKCIKPHFEIDTTNKIVMCSDCGAVIDPMDALIIMSKKWEQLEEYQRKAIERINSYNEAANAELNRMLKSKVFRTMQSNYNQELFPHCPKCGEVFDPVEMTRWTNKNSI